jgi:hypothetical protein
LRTTIEPGIGLQPLRADDIHYDIAWSNFFPAEQGQHGTAPLDIGRGVQVRAIGNVKLGADGVWRVQHFNAQQHPSGRELTIAQSNRAVALIGELIGAWAATHAGDIAQADDIDRNNGARRLEETIRRHEEALSILRRELTACEEGEPFTQYPDLPTDR